MLLLRPSLCMTKRCSTKPLFGHSFRGCRFRRRFALAAVLGGRLSATNSSPLPASQLTAIGCCFRRRYDSYAMRVNALSKNSTTETHNSVPQRGGGRQRDVGGLMGWSGVYENGETSVREWGGSFARTRSPRATGAKPAFSIPGLQARQGPSYLHARLLAGELPS